ncbi:hypothetical protein ACEPPC_07895 [Cronobacter malonaticus]|uniref:hypothetical protein n=1 Tax=Cronobacter malonaticus TaxID=413503 RepID=UPI0039BE7B30
MFQAFQTAVFKSVAEHLKGRFPHKSLELVYADELILKDMEFLKNNNKLRWDPGLKSRVFMDMMEEHPIKLVVYYRGEPIGFAFGCYCKQKNAVHICWMEKRNDAHEDLDHQMLGIVLDCFSAYALFLKKQDMAIDTIALVSPVEGAMRYYTDSGFQYISDYYQGASAMVLQKH